jgi:hypothetical protein
MKIAVLSDIHDHIWNLEKVANTIRGKVDRIIYLGDFCAPFTAGLLAQIGVPVTSTLGNNDEDQIGLSCQGGDLFTWIPLFQEFGCEEIDGRKLAFCHYPKLGELLAKTGDYHAVFFGHTHQQVNDQLGKTLLLNPGSVCGIQQARPGKASYAIYDTTTNQAEIIYLI